jgi:lysophospholipase L1-like esterase
MKKNVLRPGLLFLVFCFFINPGLTLAQSSSRYVAGKTPFGFESEINEFLKADSASFPPIGTYLFTGSSTIRKWENLSGDFKGTRVINRGFGGSNIKALNYYINDIVLPYKPRTIVVYEGDNDLIIGISQAEFISQCDTFIKKVHAALPKTMIYFMSVKPSFARKQYLSIQEETNSQLKKLTQQRRQTGYIDVAQLMYTKAGKLRKDFFESDSLHVNKGCYKVWADYMKEKIGIPK